MLDMIYGEARLYELNRSSTDVRLKELQAETLPSSDRSRIRIGKFRNEAICDRQTQLDAPIPYLYFFFSSSPSLPTTRNKVVDL